MNNTEYIESIPVDILGATGAVGQRLIQRLQYHPWFKIQRLCASDRSAKKKYGDATQWRLATRLDPRIAKMHVEKCVPDDVSPIAFSGLDADIKGDIEADFANAGYAVVSNAKTHRMDVDVPLLIPEVNQNHLNMIKHQRFNSGGAIITNPNCSTIGLTMALKPFHDNWGIEVVDVTTLQAASGGGYNGVPSMDLIDNVVPYIGGEEEKIETEPKKILGEYRNEQFHDASMDISAQCTRVAVIEGHLECVKIGLRRSATLKEVQEVLRSNTSPLSDLNLPSAPDNYLHFLEDPSHPQPRLHRDLEDGMAASIGRLQECNYLDFRFVVLSHNTIRGAAGAAILNAELLVRNEIGKAFRPDSFEFSKPKAF